MQHFHEYPGPDVCIAIMNQEYQRCRKSTTLAGREAAEQTFLYCHDQLRQHGVKFHLAPNGQWVLDSLPSLREDRIAL